MSGPQTFKVWAVLDHKGNPLDVLLFKPGAPFAAETTRGTLTLERGKPTKKNSSGHARSKATPKHRSPK